MSAVVMIRQASPADQPHRRQAIVELQDYERVLHATRLPGEQVAGAYLEWLQRQAAADSGAIFVATATASSSALSSVGLRPTTL